MASPRLQTRRGSPPQGPVANPPPWIAGRQWGQFALRQPGWLILPLRGFLAITFTYAGLQKLANPAYLDPKNRGSVVGQMQSLRHTSPIGPLLGLSIHAPTLVGLLIAFGELAVGVGVLVGLWTRLAAVGGMVLSLTFFLTVSWATTPYYYGSDIVFFFAWSTIAGLGAGDVLSLDGWLHSRARQETGLAATPAAFTVDAQRIRAVCPRDSACGLNPNRGCTQRAKCPVLGQGQPSQPNIEPDVKRRQLLMTARAAVFVAVGALSTGGATALLGRLAGGNSGRNSALNAVKPAPHSSARKKAPRSRSGGTGPKPGVAIGSASAVPIGQAAQFTDPGSGGPAWLVHPAANHFVAFSATCTHAGCSVSFDASAMEFICPCHGGAYDARTGQVLGGPPPSPLPSIPVHVINGTIRVD